jgi:uncharacterized protein YbjT (DUF2867 family)
MKLIILGATAGTGLELIRRSLVHHHSVTAFVRNPGRLQETFDGKIEIRRGDPLDRQFKALGELGTKVLRP